MSLGISISLLRDASFRAQTEEFRARFEFSVLNTNLVDCTIGQRCKIRASCNGIPTSDNGNTTRLSDFGPILGQIVPYLLLSTATKASNAVGHSIAQEA